MPAIWRVACSVIAAAYDLPSSSLPVDYNRPLTPRAFTKNPPQNEGTCLGLHSAVLTQRGGLEGRTIVGPSSHRSALPAQGKALGRRGRTRSTYWGGRRSCAFTSRDPGSTGNVSRGCHAQPRLMPCRAYVQADCTGGPSHWRYEWARGYGFPPRPPSFGALRGVPLLSSVRYPPGYTPGV